MEMPKDCLDCPCVNHEYGYCQADEEVRQIGDPDVRPSWCPIICSLPEGHGRLVDEKSVRWTIDDIVLEIAQRTGRVGMTKDETMEYVNSLYTIVPAEAERSET
jgi:hypothetical protein